MFNNHVNHFVPNFYVPPPQLPPQPLNSSRVYFPTGPPPQQHFYPQPHMNPQFFNLSVPPPPIAQNIANLISTNINNYSNRHFVNGVHRMTTSERFSKTFHVGQREKGFTSKSHEPPNRSRKRFLEKNTNEESISGELRIELDTDKRSRPLSGLSGNDVDQEAGYSDESPNSKESRCSEISQESIYLVPTDNDSDGEHLDMGRNWRMLMLFNGLVKDEDLTSDCERPQKEEGRTYPHIQKKELIVTQKPEEQKEEQRQLLKPLLSQSLPNTSNEITADTNGSGLGYTTRTSNVWVSNDLLTKMVQQQSITATSSVVNGHTIPPPLMGFEKSNRQPVTNESDPPATRKRFHHNRTLIILKNGRRIYAGSKDCFQFLETEKCLNGIFCEFEHDGSTEHAAKKVCPVLMRGQCRNTDDTCPNGPHSTLKAHQMPICDYYLRMCCSKGKEQCAYLHVKHTDGMDPCEEFNKGCCQQGVMCNAPHRYRYYRIKEKQYMERSKQRSATNGEGVSCMSQFSTNHQNSVTEQHDNLHSLSSNKQQNDTLKWFS